MRDLAIDEVTCLRVVSEILRHAEYECGRAAEIAKLDLIEKEAWQAWEFSKSPQQTAVVHENTSGQTRRKTVRQSPGDSCFLMIILTCLERRRSLTIL